MALPALGQRATLLLEALLGRPGEILTKAELMDAAWGSLAIEESNLAVQIAALRRALGSPPGGGEWIATIHRVGYRFLVPTAETGTARRSETGAIAVLPFVSLSPDSTQTFFCDGLAEDIITALARLETLTVIARNSSFSYRGSDVDIRRVGDDLAVQHVVTGSVRRAGARIRISVQLADTQSGGQIWAETFEPESTDDFAIQDEVTERVVTGLQQVLGLAARTKASSGGTRDAEALELYHRGRAILEDPQTSAERNAEARALFEQAVARDPHFADALVFLTRSHLRDHANDWGTNQDSLTLARASADAAIAAAPDVAGGHAVRSVVAGFDWDPERKDRESALAMTLDPNSVMERASFLVDNGDPESAIPLFEHAIRVNPTMTPLFMHHLARAYLHAERYATAAAIFRARIALVPNTDLSRALLCVALGHLGEIEEAQRVWAELMAINPRYSLEQRIGRAWSGDPRADELKREGLRRAGLPLV